jgi:hypothetical protein
LPLAAMSCRPWAKTVEVEYQSRAGSSSWLEICFKYKVLVDFFLAKMKFRCSKRLEWDWWMRRSDCVPRVPASCDRSQMLRCKRFGDTTTHHACGQLEILLLII